MNATGHAAVISLTLLALSLLAPGCGAKPTASTNPGAGAAANDGGRDGGAAPVADADPTAEPPSTASLPVAAADAPSEAECLALIDHTLEIGLAEQRRTKPPELVPTAEQVAEIRKALAVEMIPTCRALERAVYQCVMAAPSRPEMISCQPAVESTPQP